MTDHPNAEAFRQKLEAVFFDLMIGRTAPKAARDCADAAITMILDHGAEVKKFMFLENLKNLPASERPPGMEGEVYYGAEIGSTVFPIIDATREMPKTIIRGSVYYGPAGEVIHLEDKDGPITLKNGDALTFSSGPVRVSFDDEPDGTEEPGGRETGRGH